MVLADTPIDRITEKARYTSNQRAEEEIDKITASKLSPVEIAKASQWMLQPEDWVKYKRIMEGPRGIWSPGLDPITALGVEATNPEERLRMARIWMKIESQRAEKELAFEVARQLAGQEMHGNKKLVEDDAWVRAWEEKQKKVRKQVLLFVDQSCREECKELITDVKASVKHNARLDIFFAAGATNQDLQEWAIFMGIEKEEVMKRQITLNHNQGKSSSSLLSPRINMNELPQVRVLDLDTMKMIATFRD